MAQLTFCTCPSLAVCRGSRDDFAACNYGLSGPFSLMPAIYCSLMFPKGLCKWHENAHEITHLNMHRDIKMLSTVDYHAKDV